MKLGMGRATVALIVCASWLLEETSGQILYEWSFAAHDQGFQYEDDLFRGTAEPDYASGSFLAGSLNVKLGGIDGADISDMSGGWKKDFEITTAVGVRMVVDYSVDFSSAYDMNPREYSEILCSLAWNGSEVAPLIGDRVIDTYDPVSAATDARSAVVPFGSLEPGSYTLGVGGYNNLKSTATELTNIYFLNIRLEVYDPSPTTPPVAVPTALPTAAPQIPVGSPLLLYADFNQGSDAGFSFAADVFRGTNQPFYSSGSYEPMGGPFGGALRLNLGGLDGKDIADMSGAFSGHFSLPEASTDVRLTVEYSVFFSNKYDLDPYEYSEVLCSLLTDDGSSVIVVDHVIDTYDKKKAADNLRTAEVVFGALDAGSYAFFVGGYNNLKTTPDEFTIIYIYSISVTRNDGQLTTTPVAAPVVSGIDPAQLPFYATFDSQDDTEGFVFVDDLFGNLNVPTVTSGAWDATGSLFVSLGGVDNADVNDISAGWVRQFELTEPKTVRVDFDYLLDVSSSYEPDEFSQIWVSLNGNLYGPPQSQDYVAQADGDGNGVPNTQFFNSGTINLGNLDSGIYTLGIGGYNNQKTESSEVTLIYIDNVRIASLDPVPTLAPVVNPVPAPTSAPTMVPTAPSESRFADIRINCGQLEQEFVDTASVTWGLDRFYNANSGTRSVGRNLKGTDNDDLYRSNRGGDLVAYTIPVFAGRDYDIFVHFAELDVDLVNERVFNVSVNGEVKLENIDVLLEAGAKDTPVVKYIFIEDVASNSLQIEFIGVISTAFVSAISVNEQLPHFSHAVPGGPYVGVDRDGSGFGYATVNGDQSHTHAFGNTLTEWNWYVGDQRVAPNATGETTDLYLPVGVHSVYLDVIDSGGNFDGLATTVEIKPFGFPFLDALNPIQGQVGDLEDNMTITGVGFTFSENETSVFIGLVELTGPDAITIVDENTIFVKAVPDVRFTTGPVDVSVQTPNGLSPALVYKFIAGPLFEFEYGQLATFIFGPTVVKFGPDGKLYVANQIGYVYKLTLDDDFNVISSVESAAIAFTGGKNPYSGNQDFRTILGMTFHPSDTKPNPTVYVSHAILFHGEQVAWVDRAVNGKVTALDGAQLDEMTDIVTGLPISDLDHSVNGLEFGQDGELYIQVGGNTNAGVPGKLSTSQTMVDNYFSSATLVAYLDRPGFDGVITYDNDNGDQTGGFDVEVFAAGQRNPFDIVLHSNGFLYGTDNGPNAGFGNRATGCSTTAGDPSEPDELNLIEKDEFYGMANRKRGETDPKQCIWRSVYEQSDANYTAPMELLVSSTNGIIEWETQHFEGQLRGQLVLGKYDGGLFRGGLSEDGRTATEVVPFLDQGGLQLTQAPDGSIFVARLTVNAVAWQRPIEAASENLVIKSAFPRRGPRNGNMQITLHGENFSGSPSVTVGGAPCTGLNLMSDKKMSCMTPPGTGNSDIVVSIGGAVATLPAGHRYTNMDTVTLAPTTSPAPSQGPQYGPVHLINCGDGGAYVSPTTGLSWGADKYYSGGFTFARGNSIDNTEDDFLYQTERYADSATGDLIYELPVGPGTYDVELHFAEIFRDTVGYRVMNILIEGTQVLSDYDIVAVTGGAYVAKVETFPDVAVSDGNLTITLARGTRDPKISAIAVLGYL